MADDDMNQSESDDESFEDLGSNESEEDEDDYEGMIDGDVSKDELQALEKDELPKGKRRRP